MSNRKVHPDASELHHWMKQLQAFYTDFIVPMAEVTTKVKKTDRPYDLGDLVDLGWCFREIGKFADDLRKEANSRQELIGRLVALEATKRVLADPEGAELNVEGTFATGLPDVKQSPKLPKAGTPEYKALCASLGVEGDARAEGLVRFHFPSMVQWVSDRLEAGEPEPAGLLGTYPVYRTTFRTKRRKKNDG